MSIGIMRIEVLESRIAPAVITVTSLLDTAVTGKTNLRQAIASANSGDTIDFTAGLKGSILLTAPVDISTALTINGIGSAAVSSSAHNAITVNGKDEFQIFDITAPGDVTINNLNFTKGSATYGGAIYAGATGTSGVTIEGCNFTLNRAYNALTGSTGGSAAGGAIFLEAGDTLNLSHSMLSGNYAYGGLGNATGGNGSGGAVYAGKNTTSGFSSDVFTGNSAFGGVGNGVEGGKGRGGAIFSYGSVTVNEVTIAKNVAFGGSSPANSNLGGEKGAGPGGGGGLYLGSTGTSTITNDLFTKNLAVGGTGIAGVKGSNGTTGGTGGAGAYGGDGGEGYGGALAGSGSLSLTACTISGNTAFGGIGGAGGSGGKGGPGHGATKAGAGGSGGSGGDGGNGYAGAIQSQYTGAKLSVSSSTISGNTAIGGKGGKGGAAGAGAHSTTPPAKGSNGHAGNGDVGGINSYQGASFIMTGTVVTKNQGTYQGGVDAYNTLSVSISDCTISKNSATFDVGGIEIGGTKAVATISDTTISGNSAHSYGGGVYVYNSTLTLSQVTISGNTAGFGGGININGTGANTNIDNCTIAYNKASLEGGGIFIHTSLGATLLSTVVADNTVAGGKMGPDVDGTLDATYSLFGSDKGLTIDNTTTTSDQNYVNVNPLLEALKNNGGSTETILFNSSSQLVGHGDNPDTASYPTGLPYDQRGSGFARETNGATDIGAVQVQST